MSCIAAAAVTGVDRVFLPRPDPVRGTQPMSCLPVHSAGQSGVARGHDGAADGAMPTLTSGYGVCLMGICLARWRELELLIGEMVEQLIVKEEKFSYCFWRSAAKAASRRGQGCKQILEGLWTMGWAEENDLCVSQPACSVSQKSNELAEQIFQEGGLALAPTQEQAPHLKPQLINHPLLSPPQATLCGQTRLDLLRPPSCTHPAPSATLSPELRGPMQ